MTIYQQRMPYDATEAETEVLQVQAHDTQNCKQITRSWKDAWMDFPLQIPEGAWECQYFGLRFLYPRTVKQYTSVLLSHILPSILFWQSLESHPM